MRRIKSSLLLLVSAVAGLAASACQTGGVGDPCVPEREYDQTFSGYDVTQVYTESRSFQCESRLCLVNHFAGRVSCPYGQASKCGTPTTGRCATPADANSVDPSLSIAAKCYVPGVQAADNPVNEITVPVPAQIVSRPTSKAVYCSCRCAGPDSSARYCQCPSGFSCTELIPQGLVTVAGDNGGGQLAGSYCIKAGTAVDNPATLASETTCDQEESNLGCGPVHPDGIGQ